MLVFVSTSSVHQSRKSAKAILDSLKIEMAKPHITASAMAALYSDPQPSLKLKRLLPNRGK